MTDYKRCVDEIRFFLQSDARPGDGRVREAALKYLEACRQVNDRLRQCEGCLRQRLAAEAVHLAEVEPRLLELYAILEILENLDPDDEQRWEEFLAEERLEKPPPLRREVALELNQAYLQVQPLEELLRRYRLLSWSKAPLGERLPVLRELSRLSPNNQLWADDVRAFEQERLKALAAEVDAAVRKGDTAVMQQLLTEIDGTRWLSPPPPDLRNRLQSSSQAVHRSALIPRLERDLLQAWAATDADRVRQLRDELGRVIGPPTGPDPTWKRLHPALHWLEAEEAFQDGVTKLKDLLESPATEQELYRWYDYLHEFKRPLPEWLENMFETRVLEMRRTGYERKVLALVIGTVLFIIVAIGVAAFVLNRG